MKKNKNVRVIDKYGREVSPCDEKTAWVLLNRKRAIRISDNTIKIIVDQNDLKRIRSAVIKRDNRTCIYCGRKIPKNEPATVDHLIPKHIQHNGEIGYDSMNNLACCCNTCNRHKGMMDFERYCILRVSIVLAIYAIKTNIDIKRIIDTLIKENTYK